MMVWLLGTAAVMGILITWFFIPGKPRPAPFASPDALARLLECLRYKGLEGGELRIQAKDDERRTVVVIKHIMSQNDIELQGTVRQSPFDFRLGEPLEDNAEFCGFAGR